MFYGFYLAVDFVVLKTSKDLIASCGYHSTWHNSIPSKFIATSHSPVIWRELNERCLTQKAVIFIGFQ